MFHSENDNIQKQMTISHLQDRHLMLTHEIINKDIILLSLTI